MAQIASFGDVIFEVNYEKIYTIRDMSMDGSARYEEHDILMNKPKLEFIGAGLEELSFEIQMRAELGVNPKNELNKLRAMRDSGHAAHFLLGLQPLLKNRSVITNIRAEYKRIETDGIVTAIDAVVTLKEYIQNTFDERLGLSDLKQITSVPSPSKKLLGVATITAESLVVYSDAGTTYSKLGYVLKGQQIQVFGMKKGFYFLGSSKYISAQNMYSDLRRV